MNNSHHRIACVGEAMIELVLNADGSNANIGFAGDTLNTAIYLKRDLPTEDDVAFVSVIGTDLMSSRMVDFIQAQSVSTTQLSRIEDRLPGLYTITTDDAGERSFAYWRESSAARTLFQTNGEADFSCLDSFDVVYLSAITLAILPPEIRAALLQWIETFRATGGRFAFDSNYRPRLWENVEVARETLAQAWRLCDIGMPSVDDEMALFGDADEMAALARLNDYGIKTGALKRGASGPLPINQTIEPMPGFTPAMSVVDTTAAGDSFNGAFLAALLSGETLRDALLAGHHRAVRVIGYRGAIMPADS